MWQLVTNYFEVAVEQAEQWESQAVAANEREVFPRPLRIHHSLALASHLCIAPVLFADI